MFLNLRYFWGMEFRGKQVPNSFVEWQWQTKRSRQIRNLADVLCYEHIEERTKLSVRQKESFRRRIRGRKLWGSWLSCVEVPTGFQWTLIDRWKYLTLGKILWKLIPHRTVLIIHNSNSTMFVSLGYVTNTSLHSNSYNR